MINTNGVFFLEDKMKFVAFFVAALGLATTAQATTLTFDGNICGGGLACNNGSPIDQSYGDETGLDVQWDASSASGNQDFNWWGPSYSDLTNVGYSGGDQALITLNALAGYKVTLNGFDLGAWPNFDRTTRLRVYELGTGNDFLPDTGSFVVSGQTATSYSSLNFTSSNGIVIDFGPDFFNVGIDNIDFTVMRTDLSQVPLPAGGLLLFSGVMGLTALRRRRRS